MEDSNPITFFNSVYRRFERAEDRAGGPVDRFYLIGGYHLRLRFAGPVLVPLFTRALDNLAAQPTPTPALTICIWDAAPTGIDLPSLYGEADVHLPDGGVSGYNDDRVFYAAINLGSGILNLLDMETNTAVYVVGDVRRLPDNDIYGSPLLLILNWWMGRQGRRILHAGAVGRSSGGVLLAGRSGTGKSTTALACLDSELDYLSDDYCLLDTTSPLPFVSSIYNTGKLTEEVARQFPNLTGRRDETKSGPASGDKHLIFGSEEFPDKLSPGFPIRAILLPHFTGKKETTARPVSPMTALKSLAPSTIFQLHRAGSKTFQDRAAADTFREIARLTRLVPSFVLETGYDLRQIPRVIMSLLS